MNCNTHHQTLALKCAQFINTLSYVQQTYYRLLHHRFYPQRPPCVTIVSRISIMKTKIGSYFLSRLTLLACFIRFNKTVKIVAKTKLVLYGRSSAKCLVIESNSYRNGQFKECLNVPCHDESFGVETASWRTTCWTPSGLCL